MIKIEKGIPKPPQGRLGRTAKYPWAEMEIGDSFLIPDKPRSSVSGMAAGQGRRRGGRFSCRTVDGGVRVWRDE